MPTLVLVLPTSTTRSISEHCDLAGNHAMAALTVLEHQSAIDVEVDRDAGDAVDRDTPSDGIGDDEPARANGCEPLTLQLCAPTVERLEHRLEHDVAPDVSPRLEPDRRCASGAARGKRALPEVDADADRDDAGARRGPCAHGGGHPALEEDAGDLAAADENVVGPLESSVQSGHPSERVGDGQSAHERIATPTLRRR